jgi:hypothetical protein
MAVGLMFCALTTMEFPELIKLVDDTSNDFSLVLFVKNAPSVVKVQMPRQGRPTSADALRRHAAAFFSAHSLIPVFHASVDMLHMLCLQRT